MRAFVITGPHEAGVQDVPPPVAEAGEVVVDVVRAGVCGTDVELYTGEMPYLHDGRARYPLRIGHEWCGVVSGVAAGVDSAWIGMRVTGDTMLGCGRCDRCLSGRHHVCQFLVEVGISQGRPGALAEKVAVPAVALRELPASVDDVMGAMVEPGGNALRAAKAAALRPGERLLILGAGTIGLLTAMFATADGLEVHLLGRSERSLGFARSLGFDSVWNADTLPDLAWHGVIDASNDPRLPDRAVELVEPSRTVVLVGLAPEPSSVDTRKIALKDVTAVGLLSGSPGLDGAIEAYASGTVDPRPLVAATIDVEDVADVLEGKRPAGASDGPKTLIQI